MLNNLQKIMLVSLVLVGTVSNAKALDGSGTVEEIRICGNDATRANNMYFRLSDGTWFRLLGSYSNSNFAGITMADATSQSIVLLAYANNHTVNVRATGSIGTKCGLSAPLFWKNNGDYLGIQK